MSKWKIARLAFDAEHKRLMLAYHRARGGERTAALKRLKKYVGERLEEARQG